MCSNYCKDELSLIQQYKLAIRKDFVHSVSFWGVFFFFGREGIHRKFRKDRNKMVFIDSTGWSLFLRGKHNFCKEIFISLLRSKISRNMGLYWIMASQKPQLICMCSEHSPLLQVHLSHTVRSQSHLGHRMGMWVLTQFLGFLIL